MVSCWLGLMMMALTVVATAAAPDTFFWDGNKLEESRQRYRQGDRSLTAAVQRAVREAEFALTQGPFSVMDKESVPPSGDRHDFYDLSPYWWPNPWLPGGRPYYWRDGKKNPEAETKKYDRKSFLVMQDCLQRLSLAYYFTGEEKYASYASSLIKRWFLNPETRMNSHFQYSQTIPGLKDGDSLGIIRGVELVEMVDASELIRESPSWTVTDRENWRHWFRLYLEWVRFSDFGKTEFGHTNNHGTWYDAHVSALGIYVGKPEIAREILSGAGKRRIEHQIRSDGTQPEELSRSRSFEYSIYNLRGLFMMARVGDRISVDLWSYCGGKGESLQKALDWLLPYATGMKKWEHAQLETKKEPMADLLWLLCMADEKYPKGGYAGMLSKMPALGVDHRLRLFYSGRILSAMD